MFLIIYFFENLLILFSIILLKKGFVIWGVKIVIDGIVISLGSKLFEKFFDIKTYLFWAILQPFYIPFVGTLGLFNKFSWKK